MAPCEKSKIAFFAFLMMKNIAVFPSRSKVPGKLFSCIAFGSESSTCCLLESITISL